MWAIQLNRVTADSLVLCHLDGPDSRAMTKEFVEARPGPPSGRSPKLAAFVAQNGPQDHFVCLTAKPLLTPVRAEHWRGRSSSGSVRE